MVVFDATTLLLLLSPNVEAPTDPATGQKVELARERVDFLVQQLEKSRAKIIVPTPALSEILVRSGAAGPDYLNMITTSSAFRVVAFDLRAAVEVAAMTRIALNEGDKRGGGEGTWAKIKYDRQIMAIAKVEGASAIYSDDDDIHLFARNVGIQAIRLAQLPLPPQDAQTSLFAPDQLPSDDREDESTE